jgi:hypothetical protein
MAIKGAISTARFYGHCPGTRHPIEPGDTIEYDGTYWTHLACPYGSRYQGYGHARIILGDGPHDIRIVRGIQIIDPRAVTVL